MKFWRIGAPPYSDYHHTFINGKVTYAYSFPGIDCPTCGDIWSKPVMVQPWLVDDRFDARQFPRGPISISEFHLRRSIILKNGRRLLGAEKDPDFQPGNKLLPAYLEVPSTPRASFLWGGWAPVITGEVLRLLKDSGLSGCLAHQINLTKVGKREAKLPPPIPRSGEPEDIMAYAEMPPSAGEELPDYHQLVVLQSSSPPKNVTFSSPCTECGFESWSIPNSKTEPAWCMNEEMWMGADFFFLYPSSMIAVTDRIKSVLEEHGATNVSFEAIPLNA